MMVCKSYLNKGVTLKNVKFNGKRMFNLISEISSLSISDIMLSKGGFSTYNVSYMSARTQPTFFTFISQPLAQ